MRRLKLTRFGKNVHKLFQLIFISSLFQNCLSAQKEYQYEYDITGINKIELIKELIYAAKPLKIYNSGNEDLDIKIDIDDKIIKSRLNHCSLFSYYENRILNVYISSFDRYESINVYFYDKYNGIGTAEKVINRFKAKNKKNSEESKKLITEE